MPDALRGHKAAMDAVAHKTTVFPANTHRVQKQNIVFLKNLFNSTFLVFSQRQA